MNRSHLETIRSYWSGRVAAYAAVNADELDNAQAKVWDELIAEQLSWSHPLRILDVGCGPGFFSILMARRGHEVTGVDYSGAMMECARQNFKKYSVEARARFLKMDAQNLTFGNNAFDVVLSCNLTWNLEHPGRASRNGCVSSSPAASCLISTPIGMYIYSIWSLPGCTRKMLKSCVTWGMPSKMNIGIRLWTS